MLRLLRPLALAALALAVASPEAAAQRRPRPDPHDDRGDRGDREGRDERRERPRMRRTPAHPMDAGITAGLYAGSVDGLPTGGLRVGVGRARFYAEASESEERHGGGGHDEPEQTAVGIDLLLPARAPGLQALYGIAGVGIQHREANERYDDWACPQGGDCVHPYYHEQARSDFYGALGLGMRVPVWGPRVALSGEITGRFVADRYGDTYAVPTATAALTVRLR